MTMQRIEINVQTGVMTVIPLTSEEESAALALSAVDTLDARAARTIDAKDRLQFEIEFDQEKRIRVVEGRPAITKLQYRDALIAQWKVLNP